MNKFERETVNKILSLKRESRNKEANDLEEWLSRAKALQEVIESDDLTTYKNFKKNHGVDFVGFESQTTIELAARYGAIDIFRFLIEEGAKYDADNISKIAAWHGEVPMGYVNSRWRKIIAIVEKNK